jgi:Ulp1 family protease
VFLKEKLEQVTASPGPEQKNGYDCGLFVLMGIRLISSGRRHLSQAQSDDIMPTFRQRVLAKLLALSLNPLSTQFEEFKRKEAHADTIVTQANRVDDRSISAAAGDHNR